MVDALNRAEERERRKLFAGIREGKTMVCYPAIGGTITAWGDRFVKEDGTYGVRLLHFKWEPNDEQRANMNLRASKPFRGKYRTEQGFLNAIATRTPRFIDDWEEQE